MSLYKVAVAIALLGLVSAKPLTFKLKREKSSFAKRDMKSAGGLYDYIGAFENVLASITKRQSADLTVDLSNLDNFKYTTTILVGSDN